MTLNDGLREEFEKMLATPEYKELTQDLDVDILKEAFEALLQVKGSLDFDPNTMENAKIAIVQSLRNNLLNTMKR